MLNASDITDNLSFLKIRKSTVQNDSTCPNKENVSANRPLIKIKPRKYLGNYHLLWCKEGDNRSELIRL
jgi:hypothetical protein